MSLLIFLSFNKFLNLSLRKNKVSSTVDLLENKRDGENKIDGEWYYGEYLAYEELDNVNMILIGLLIASNRIKLARMCKIDKLD